MDGTLDARHKHCADTQFIHPQPKKQWSQRNVAGHLAAHAYPNIVRVCGIGDHFEQTHHRWMRRLVKMRNPLIHSIDRQRVLNQIVRADAEELDLAREHIGRNRSARDFDHRADFDFLADVDLLRAQCFLAFV